MVLPSRPIVGSRLPAVNRVALALGGSLLFGSPTPQEPRRPPVVVGFAIGERSGTLPAGADVPLVHRVAGARPSHYRVSVRTDFANATWLPYQDRPVWRATRTGAEPRCPDRTDGSFVRLYFQVRTALGEEVRVVDGRRVLRPVTLESNVQLADACIVPGKEP